MSPRFRRLYAKRAQLSIAPEKLQLALLLQLLYTIRSEWQLVRRVLATSRPSHDDPLIHRTAGGATDPDRHSHTRAEIKTIRYTVRLPVN